LANGDAPTTLLRKAPKSAGAAITLATDVGLENGGFEVGLRFAMDDAALYWGDRKDHLLVKYPKSGGAPVVLAQGADADWVRPPRDTRSRLHVVLTPEGAPPGGEEPAV
jgi:hypothetical protein